MDFPFTEFIQLGIGGAALAVLVVIVKVFKDMVGKLMRHTSATTDDVLTFFGNHMSESVRQQQETARALQDVAVSLEKLSAEIRKDRADG